MISKEFKIFHWDYENSLGRWGITIDDINDMIGCFSYEHYYLWYYEVYSFYNTYKELEKDLKRD